MSLHTMYVGKKKKRDLKIMYDGPPAIRRVKTIFARVKRNGIYMNRVRVRTQIKHLRLSWTESHWRNITLFLCKSKRVHDDVGRYGTENTRGSPVTFNA